MQLNTKNQTMPFKMAEDLNRYYYFFLNRGHTDREAITSLTNREMEIKTTMKYYLTVLGISSVQFSSVTQSCLTLCDPTNGSMPSLPVRHQLPEFKSKWVNLNLFIITRLLNPIWFYWKQEVTTWLKCCCSCTTYYYSTLKFLVSIFSLLITVFDTDE